MLFFPIAIAWTFCPVLNESDKNESVCLTPNNIGKTFNTAVLNVFPILLGVRQTDSFLSLSFSTGQNVQAIAIGKKSIHNQKEKN